MQCPKCKSDSTRVLDSRDTDEGRAIRRRRECEDCNFRFTTFERFEGRTFRIIKKDRSRETYNPEKLKRGIWKSCEKRPVTEEDIDKMVEKLEEKWSSQGKEIASELIGADIMEALKKLDEVAYIRFASVYRHFKDIESFKEELASLLEKR